MQDSLLITTAAHSKVPIAQRHALSALGRAGQNGLHARQERDRGDLVGFGAGRTRYHQSVARFQVRQTQRRHTLDHLLEISSGAVAARSTGASRATWGT